MPAWAQLGLPPAAQAGMGPSAAADGPSCRHRRPLPNARSSAATRAAGVVRCGSGAARALLRALPGTRSWRPARRAGSARAMILVVSGRTSRRCSKRGARVPDSKRRDARAARRAHRHAARPPGVSTRRALRDLREADPNGSYDFDHLFVSLRPRPRSPPLRPRPARSPRPSTCASGSSTAASTRARRVRDAPPQVQGATARRPRASTARPSHRCSSACAPEFHGAAPGAELVAVDVYCDGATPGGRVRDIVVALGQLAAANVRVIDMSVVGPDNAVLAASYAKCSRNRS